MISLKTALKACQKGLHWELTLELLEEMRAHGIAPGAVACRAGSGRSDPGRPGTQMIGDRIDLETSRDALRHSAC